MALQGIAKGTAVSGSIHKVATYEISENAESRQIQRITLNDQDGNDMMSSSTASDPADVTMTDADTNYIAVTAGAKVGWLIDNQSDTEIRVGFSNNLGAVGKSGVRVFPGGSYGQQGPGTFTGNVYIRCTSAAKTVMVQIW